METLQSSIRIPEDRSEFGKVAIQLFSDLDKVDPAITKCLIRKYRGLPVDPEIEEMAYEHFIDNSVICAAGAANNGSSMVTEFLYTGIDNPSPIDRYLISSMSGRAIGARRVAIEEYVYKLLTTSSAKKIVIGNLGSGPGRDLSNILLRLTSNNPNRPKIKAVNIDKDSMALRRGKTIAKRKQVDHLLKFVKANFLRHKPSEKFDIALLVGVLCPLSTEDSIRSLKLVKDSLKKNGLIIASASSQKMLKEDPFTSFLMEWIANWRLIYKNQHDLEEIFSKAGYRWNGFFSDFYGFHLMGVGTPS